MDKQVENWVTKLRILGDEAIVEKVNDKIILKHLDTKSKKIVIPGFINTIGVGAFRYSIDFSKPEEKINSNLEEIIFENGVQNIGASAFNTGIKHVDIPKTVKTLQSSTFFYIAIERITLHGKIAFEDGAIKTTGMLKEIEGSHFIRTLRRYALHATGTIKSLDLRKCSLSEFAISNTTIDRLIVGKQTELNSASFGSSEIHKLVILDCNSIDEAKLMLKMAEDINMHKHLNYGSEYVNRLNDALVYTVIKTVECHYTEDNERHSITKTYDVKGLYYV